MKNIFKVFAVAAVMLFGVESISAQSLSQDQNRPETIAKAETQELTTALSLNGDQSRAVFRALVGKHVSHQKYVEGKDLSSSQVQAENAKMNETLNDQMKKILTPEQYSKWVKSLEN